LETGGWCPRERVWRLCCYVPLSDHGRQTGRGMVSVPLAFVVGVNLNSKSTGVVDTFDERDRNDRWILPLDPWASWRQN
jgi:hypothetical protein